MPYEQKYLTLGIGAAGVYATAPNPYGDTPASVSISDTRLRAYFGEVVEGGRVMDKRTVDPYKLVHWVISGPMEKASLPPQTVERFAWKFGGDNLTHCEDAITGHCGSLDYISTDLYDKLWRELGAGIGFRRGDFIEWEDGSHTAIPPFEKRWEGEK